MPKMDFAFQGYVRGVNIQEAFDEHGSVVDVSEMSAQDLATRLQEGDLFISLGNYLDYIYSGGSGEIEISDFEAH